MHLVFYRNDSGNSNRKNADSILNLYVWHA